MTTVQPIQTPNLQPAPNDAASGASSAAANVTGAASKPESKAASAPASTASYQVSISGAARAALAEFTETSVQTAQEANRGDHQAQRLLQTEQAARAG